MQIMQIKSRWSDAVLWEGEAADLRDAVIQAAAAGADLGGANLHGADLGGADLRGANLGGADLRGANLYGADLGGADLGGANLYGADLGGADLGGANLTTVRDDVWAVLSSAPSEAAGVLLALRAGRVDGSTYTGDCACLVGTIAKVHGCRYDAVPNLKPDASRPAEAFFTAIHKGDTPENNQAARLAAEWVEQWLDAMRRAFGPQEQRHL